MKTVILVGHGRARAFSDDEIRAAVALAGRSTLIIDQQRDALAPPPPSPVLDRTAVQVLSVQNGDGQDVRVSDDVELNRSDIWLLDLAGLTSRQIGLVLWSLRSRMFSLPEPPPAVVFKTDASAHVAVFKRLRSEFGSSTKRRKHLAQARRQTRWLALALRVFGHRGYKISKKLFKLRQGAAKAYKRKRSQ